MPSWAGRQFDIEVIIFKRALDAKNTHETWPNELPNIEMSRAGSLDDVSYRQSKGVSLLPRSAYRLNRQATALNNHAGFKVLKHVAWRQGDQGKASAPIFHIVGGRDFSDSYQANGQASHGDWSSATIDDKTYASEPKPLYELDGTLQIYVQHYLFADTMLDFREPTTRTGAFASQAMPSTDVFFGTKQETNLKGVNEPKAPDTQDATTQVGNFSNILPSAEQESFLQTIRMDQTRRMRSGEIHYLDNPLVGMLIQVRPVK